MDASHGEAPGTASICRVAQWEGSRPRGDVSEPEILRSAHELDITRTIASGGMGTVYEALPHGAAGFSKTVAAKTIRGRYARDPGFVRLFIGEARLERVPGSYIRVFREIACRDEMTAGLFGEGDPPHPISSERLGDVDVWGGR